MSNEIKTFLFIMLIPFFAALGHDLYVNYFNTDAKIERVKELNIDPKKFMISDLGWIIDEYVPKTLKKARTQVERPTWKKKIDPILQSSTMLVSLVPFLTSCAYLIFAFIIGVFPFSRFGKGKRTKHDDFAVYKHAQEKSIKFKRRK
jgi:hypothetical protein